MLILTIRTDRPVAEIGLFEDSEKLVYETWEAHRQLAETLHGKIATLLQKIGKDWSDIEGLVCYKGPGSFTGLRIGISLANAMAYANQVPIAGETGDEWAKQGVTRLRNGQSDDMVVPEYGAEAHITQQRK